MKLTLFLCEHDYLRITQDIHRAWGDKRIFRHGDVIATIETKAPVCGVVTHV